MSSRRFPPPWTVEQIPGGFKVLDASGQALVYVYARETKAEADIAKVLTFDEARRIAVNEITVYAPCGREERAAIAFVLVDLDRSGDCLLQVRSRYP